MNRKSVMKVMIDTLKKNIWLDIFLVLMICGVVISSLIPPQILKTIIDNNLITKDYNNLLILALLYFIVVIFIGIFDFLKEIVLTILGQRITKAIRSAMMEKFKKLNSLFFSNNTSGAIVSRFTNDVDAISSLFTNGIVGMIIDMLKIIGIIISILFFSYKLALFTLVVLPIIYLITRLFQKRMLKAQINNRILTGKVNNHISESLKNIEMIKVYGKEEYMEEKYVKSLYENYEMIEKVNFYDSIFPPIIQFIRAIIIAIIVALSSSQTKFLGITIGMVAASIDLISNLFTPVENFGMELQSIQQAMSGIRRVNDFFMEKEDDNKIDIRAEDIILAKKKLEIKFDTVGFYYEKDTIVLNNINYLCEDGKSITFIGRTGIGKTTLFKLIMGLIKPTEGKITINGVDVYEIPNSEKRKIFGYVGQNFNFLKGSIMEQITLRDQSISREKVEHALEFVGLKDYINSLEKGLDTIIKNDTLFSQGQKQLLSIARAIVNDPPILLLDEVTANLDSITEEKVISVLQKASYGHTVLSISHRLTSMISADIIVLIENGTIKNFGTPEELLKNDEWFKRHVTLNKLTWN